jgi:hypothetical protein
MVLFEQERPDETDYGILVGAAKGALARKRRLVNRELPL